MAQIDLVKGTKTPLCASSLAPWLVLKLLPKEPGTVRFVDAVKDASLLPTFQLGSDGCVEENLHLIYFLFNLSLRLI
jgi:hypothetical protein